MYILGLYSSWGTSRVCPAWSSSEHLLTPALSPFGARVRSHAVRRRLFIFLMTAAHISPNVFSLRKFLSNTWLFLTVHTKIIHTYYTSHLYAHSHLYFIRLVHIFISSDLHGRLAVLGFLCSIHKVLLLSATTEVNHSFTITTYDALLIFQQLLCNNTESAATAAEVHILLMQTLWVKLILL
jgi:hypothetical protein